MHASLDSQVDDNNANFSKQISGPMCKKQDNRMHDSELSLHFNSAHGSPCVFTHGAQRILVIHVSDY